MVRSDSPVRSATSPICMWCRLTATSFRSGCPQHSHAGSGATWTDASSPGPSARGRCAATGRALSCHVSVGSRCEDPVPVVPRAAPGPSQTSQSGHTFRYVRDDDPATVPTPASGRGLPGTGLPGTGLASPVPASPAPGAPAVLGVTVFFALSGWLITGVLMRDLDRGGRIRFGRFYGHRLLRLYPPLLLMLAGYVVVEGVFDLLGQADLVPETLVAALTYTINIPGLPHGSESVYHFWTLAAEEQFYLVWPLVLAWAWRRGWLRATTGVAVAAALAACMVT